MIIAFDFDGTIIDSMGMWRGLTKGYLEARQIPYTDAIARDVHAMSLSRCAHYLSEVIGLPETPEEIIASMGEHLINTYKTLSLRPGARETLETLREARIPFVLATATNEDYVLPTLVHFGLDDLLTEVYTVDGLGFSKGDPTFFTTLARRLGADPEEILLVDDALYALTAAKEAGLQTVAIYDRHSDGDWEKASRLADHSISEIHELPEVLPLP